MWNNSLQSALLKPLLHKDVPSIEWTPWLCIYIDLYIYCLALHIVTQPPLLPCCLNNKIALVCCFAWNKFDVAVECDASFSNLWPSSSVQASPKGPSALSILNFLNANHCIPLHSIELSTKCIAMFLEFNSKVLKGYPLQNNFMLKSGHNVHIKTINKKMVFLSLELCLILCSNKKSAWCNGYSHSGCGFCSPMGSFFQALELHFETRSLKTKFWCFRAFIGSYML